MINERMNELIFISLRVMDEWMNENNELIFISVRVMDDWINEKNINILME